MPRQDVVDQVGLARSPLVPVAIESGQGKRGRRKRRTVAFLLGMLLGLVGGAAGMLLLLLMAAARHPLLTFPSGLTNAHPDITIAIREGYLNQQANTELRTTHPIVLPFVNVTNVELDFQPGNQMRLKPTFHAAIVDVSATVVNTVQLENGQIALHMVGDPQIQDIQIPLDWLPFNLAGQVRDGVDRINNELLAAEINRQLAAGFGSDRFYIIDVTTSDDYLTVRLQAR